ncbi:hypothetical protein OH76DRAFT_597702 [Lentinus brumalis]|uniref:Uncharacterized protein n=1 Tax=Lentinus brumalis TaxID=2498619 RepID=A0A371DUG4_9APHY|nr:hypothetical protein OH76DRAFT_597702 [Polyporus brumalis]
MSYTGHRTKADVASVVRRNAHRVPAPGTGRMQRAGGRGSGPESRSVVCTLHTHRRVLSDVLHRALRGCRSPRA